MIYLPMDGSLMVPNECHQQSPLLFWTIVAVGSRKYADNPTLIILLGPKVSKLAKLALFAQEPVLLTIQAFLLLCSWPMPFEALSNDITPVLAGAVLQLATTIGLHVSGVGQEFARTRVNQDPTYRIARGKLWTLCVIVSQRIITVNGTPPLVIPDTYGDDSEELSSFVTSSFRFQKKVSEFLSMTILYIQNHALYKPADELALALDPIIRSAVDRLVQLEADSPERIDRFYVLSAQLHLLSYHLFKHRSAIEDATLLAMYELAYRTIELAMELDAELSMAEYGPIYLTKFLHSAVITILRLGRAGIAQQLDLERGQRAYFAVINYHKRHAVRPDDAFARFSIILTNLWTSRKVFQYSNGLVDSLRVRSKARLGMSMVYDCFWWWRQEFGGQSNVYGDNHVDENTNPALDHFAPGLDNDQLDLVDLDLTPIPDLQWPVFDKFFTENWPSLDLDIGISKQ
ncbi:Fungal specific transcription factor domain-containing protein [Cladophialophora immunda]|nr:Fungal specific transcription factor domain-containing protein [Cladophialophora immunda]